MTEQTIDFWDEFYDMLEMRAEFGPESKGTRIARRVRASCNNMPQIDREGAYKAAMAKINTNTPESDCRHS